MVVKLPRILVESDEIGLVVESVDAQQQSLIFCESEILCRENALLFEDVLVVVPKGTIRSEFAFGENDQFLSDEAVGFLAETHHFARSSVVNFVVIYFFVFVLMEDGGDFIVRH